MNEQEIEGRIKGFTWMLDGDHLGSADEEIKYLIGDAFEDYDDLNTVLTTVYWSDCTRGYKLERLIDASMFSVLVSPKRQFLPCPVCSRHCWYPLQYWGQETNLAPCSECTNLPTMPYEEYLKTDHWQNVRTQALARADNRCQVCNSGLQLNVHHRTYDRRGRERDTDLTVLCQTCHELFHKHGRLSR